MRFNAVAAAYSAAVLAGGAHAEDEAAASVPAELPSFTPSVVKGDFVEQFTDDWESRWKPSSAKKDMGGSGKEEEEWAFTGQWAVEEPTVYKGIEGDRGLVVKNPAQHHAISAKFPSKIDNKDNTLVVQYEVKLQNGLECGGAYMKLLRENKELHQDEFSNATPYVIMFGPDRCGTTNKVHFIFNHKNPKTGEYEEKHLKTPPSAKVVKTTELLTLIVNPDNSFVIEQNGEVATEGNLLNDFRPSVNPPQEIDDPKDTKPEDWVEESRIADPEAKKPADWDEDAPFEIIDEEAEKPADWLEKEPLVIPDPSAEKPEDWDDEEDGDFVAPSVPNPKCAEVSGCGPWSKPMIKNPEYKGKWSAPLIDNPAYKGLWAPRKIKNPDYFEDKNPSNFEPMGAIGFELWTMQNDILFDNIYIGHSVDEARKLAKETFFVKHPIEKAALEADKPKRDEKPASPSDLKFLDDPVLYVREKVDLFLTIAQNDPVMAAKFVPEVAVGIATILVTVLAGLIGLLTAGGSAPAAKEAAAATKEKAKETKDKVAQATASGADAAKDAVNKRTTRSQS